MEPDWKLLRDKKFRRAPEGFYPSTRACQPNGAMSRTAWGCATKLRFSEPLSDRCAAIRRCDLSEEETGGSRPPLANACQFQPFCVAAQSYICGIAGITDSVGIEGKAVGADR